MYRKFKVRPERTTGYSGGGEAPCKDNKRIQAPAGRHKYPNIQIFLGNSSPTLPSADTHPERTRGDELLQIFFCTTPKIVAKIESPSTQLHAVCFCDSLHNHRKTFPPRVFNFTSQTRKYYLVVRKKVSKNYAHRAGIKNNNLNKFKTISANVCNINSYVVFYYLL
ncbi:MAG: hypothetical protein HW390_1829 [Candidatus Brocadiaceae bacterium]|nr:hypothetical protein [Candidatus Brocadiaceae bacterium]